MVTENDVSKLIDDDSVISVVLCKYTASRSICFIDFILHNGKKLQDAIPEEVYDYYDLPVVLNSDRNIFTKKLK